MDINAYSIQVKRLGEKINKLTVDNRKAEREINQLYTEYEKAVSRMEDEIADKLHKRIYDIKQQMNNRANKIDILQSKKNPSLVKAGNETIMAFLKEKDKHLKQENELKKELETIKVQYFSICNKLKNLNVEYNKIKAKASKARDVANYKELPKATKSLLVQGNSPFNFAELEILVSDIQNNIFDGVI